MGHGTILLNTGDHPGTLNGSEVSRRIFLTGIGIACLGLVPFVQACDNTLLWGGKRNGMEKTGSVPRAMRPPIDASAPVDIQTATFALG